MPQGVPSLNALNAEQQFVLNVVWCCGQSFCESRGDYHVTAECVRKPVQNERELFGSHKAG